MITVKLAADLRLGIGHCYAKLNKLDLARFVKAEQIMSARVIYIFIYVYHFHLSKIILYDWGLFHL